MKTLKFSLIDNDFVVSEKTDLRIHDDADLEFAKFFRKIEEELVTGDTAYLEVEGLRNEPIKFTITHAE